LCPGISAFLAYPHALWHHSAARAAGGPWEKRVNEQPTGWKTLYTTEDWWAVWLGFILLGLVFFGLVHEIPAMPKWAGGEFLVLHHASLLLSIGGVGVGLLLLFGLGAVVMEPAAWRRFPPAFLVLFVLSALAFAIANEHTLRAYGISYAFWALIIGLLVSNTIGTPPWLRPAVRTEFYIKTGLVIFGAEILFGKIIAAGGYGLIIAWGVTPVVIVFMWLFGTRVMKMGNKHLVIIIAVATSVCGVSAAIATAAACRAKKEDLSVAVGMTLIFTVLMMVLMPWFIRAVGMSEAVGGAWMGGTIDATGAVAAAGAQLGPQALAWAAIVKMIQNVLIGVIAFCVALYWVTCVDASAGTRPGIGEIWRRFPKFVLGFFAASLLASFIFASLHGADWVEAKTDITKHACSWMFCLAFLSIGLESNFKAMGEQLVGGKPIVLYVVGQGFNLVLTLLVVWLALSGLIFPAPPVLGG
jgi:uncharacterized integral membrane protein (TIGR00698 family)